MWAFPCSWGWCGRGSQMPLAVTVLPEWGALSVLCLPHGKTPWSSPGNLGFVKPPYTVVACEGFCGCLSWNERSLECAASSTINVSLWVCHYDRAGATSDFVILFWWMISESALFAQAPLLGCKWCNEWMNHELFIHLRSCEASVEALLTQLSVCGCTRWRMVPATGTSWDSKSQWAVWLHSSPGSSGTAAASVTQG